MDTVTISTAVRAVRNWCGAAGVVGLALALVAVSNSVGNPETWSSAFHALAATGEFIHYASWFAAGGALLLVVALLLTLYLARRDQRKQ